ncbi:mite group 2 allergen Pso o 2-like [Panonychus citri]|uniref:mite group 2 allergen Pso o 2-like n=1 Tax=Panonychus citri TaxID=50023 RepID=UPI002306FF29|nr:mite group 2 allergen Pso o 2-like [Panonychus citri]XP_053212970.1 mite group 2 allergen Pso o 2-like [Panonychus citri]
MIKSIIVLCLFLAVSSARDIVHTKCDSTSGTIESFDMDPCDSDICILRPNTDVVFTGQIIPTISAEKPTLSIQVKMGYSYIEYPGLSQDACEYFECPLKANVANHFKVEMETFGWFPPMVTDMRFHVYESADGEELACAQSKIEIAPY